LIRDPGSELRRALEGLRGCVSVIIIIIIKRAGEGRDVAPFSRTLDWVSEGEGHARTERG